MPEPVSQPPTAPQPPPEPEHAQTEDWEDGFDPYAFEHDNPGWDDEPPEDDLDYISVLPDEKVPLDAGEFLRTYYAPGIGDVRVYARLDPNEMEIDPGQIIELDELDDEPTPESTPKPPK